MTRIIISISTVLLLSQQSVAVSLLKNGFVTWSEGNQRTRVLHYRTVTNGELGPVKIICQKGEAGGDIQGVISFDGKWIAFARKREAKCLKKGGQWNGNGEDDHHKHHCWSIYVARLDGDLPTTPIRVADEGCYPSWSDNSNGAVKTLYFSVWTKGEIWKSTIIDEGNKVSGVVKHATIPDWNENWDNPQCAPNGEFVAFRTGRIEVVGLNGNTFKQIIGGGDLASWFADSKHLYKAVSWVGNINGEKVGKAANYHFGSSSNMKWAITLSSNITGNQQNNGKPVKYGDVTYNNESKTIEKIGPYDSPLITEMGSWPDIHDFGVPVQVNPGSKLPAPNGFKIELTDEQLIVNTAFSGKHTIELFDVNGVRKASAVQTHSSRTVLSVKDYPRGMVILRVNNGEKTVQKKLVLF